MLRAATQNLKYFYNNRNNWRRYHKDFPLQSEPQVFKKDFKVGDQAEFLYKNKIIWPEEYKPWKNTTFKVEYLIGVVLFILYLDARYEQQVKKSGATVFHEYTL